MSNNEFIVKATPAFYQLIETEIKGTYNLIVIKNPNKNPEPSPEDLNIIDTPNPIELVETETKGTYDVIIKNVVSTFKVEIYKPNETQEIFKGMFKSVVEELSKPYTLKQTNNILMVSLKHSFLVRRGLYKTNYNSVQYNSNGTQYTKMKDVLNDKIIYSGKCHHYAYVSKYHPKVIYNKRSGYYTPSFDVVKDDKLVEKWFLDIIDGKNPVSLPKWVNFNEMGWTEFIRTQYGNNLWDLFRKNQGDKSQQYPYKVRILEKTLDYDRTPMKYFSLFNLKYWNKTTKLTSLRGLKAITDGWTYEKTNRTSGWTFGGITASSIDWWAKENGFKEEIVKITNKGKKNEKIHYKKYQYGDYAEYLLKELGGYNLNEYLLMTSEKIREKRMIKK